MLIEKKVWMTGIFSYLSNMDLLDLFHYFLYSLHNTCKCRNRLGFCIFVDMGCSDIHLNLREHQKHITNTL